MASTLKGICFTRLSDRTIDFVFVEDSTGKDYPLPVKVYISRNIQPTLKDLPERRDVTCTKKDKDRDIIGLGNTQANWMFRSKENAIKDIKSNTYKYYALWNGNFRTEIHVVPAELGEYLRTDKDKTGKNNLDELPDCP